MLKKIIALVLCLFASIASFASEAPGVASETEFKFINNLSYHRSMFDAMPSVDYLKIPFGTAPAQVGGQDQDSLEEPSTYGVPWAFRMIDGGSVWVLDSLNHELKLFKADGSLEKSVSIASYGQMVVDFAVSADGSFAFLDNVAGYINVVGADGEVKQMIEGFNGARAIEFSKNGDLLVSHPVMQAVLRFGADGELKEQLVGDQGLSLYADANERLFGLEIEELEADFYLRTVASPTETVVLHKLPYEAKQPGVSWAGGEILGLDAAGNVYLCLVACHEEGHIFRERLYRFSPEGKLLGELDILTIPHLAPDLPRKRVVCPDGRVMGFYPTEDNFVLCTYTIP